MRWEERFLNNRMHGMQVRAFILWLGYYAPLAVLVAYFAYQMTDPVNLSPSTYFGPYPGHLRNNYEMFSAIANNTINLGFFKYALSQPRWTDSSGNDVKYYLHHPPLLPILVAVSFLLSPALGITRELAAVLVPSVFGMGSLVMVYCIVARLWGTRIAFGSTLVMGLTPMFKRYSQMVVHEPLVQFFILLTLYSYIRLLEGHRKKHMALMYLSTVLGCLSGWQAYYLALLIPLHYAVFSKPRRLIEVLHPFIAGAVFLFLAINLVYTIGASGIEDIRTAFNEKTDFNPATNSLRWTNLERLANERINLYFGFTPYVLYSFLLFPLMLAHKVYGRQDVLKESYVVLLFAIGFIHDAIWPNGLYMHVYWSYSLLPSVAIASIVGLNHLIHADRKFHSFVFLLAAIVFWASTQNFGYFT
jgi:4-amino-4-deoxy-L-arabinose transferase-like glycosyltransferase